MSGPELVGPALSYEDFALSLWLSGVFRHPFHQRLDDEVELPPNKDRLLCANERNIIALSATIRNKPNWWIKAQDPDIRAKWKKEAVGAPVPYGDIPLTESEVEYALDELSWYAGLRDEETGIEPSVFHRIWQSDMLIEEDIRCRLLKGVSALEGVPDEQKDWHPRANAQVLDLVHPSLYCIVYGRTIFRDSYDMSCPKSPDVDHSIDAQGDSAENFLSTEYAWLPTDFAISEDGSTAKALGYINNLSPHSHADMYPVIEQIVARFVPLWERVLGETRVGKESHLPQRQASDSVYDWVEKPQVVQARKERRKAEREARKASGEGSDDEDSSSDEEDYTGWYEHANHDFVPPAITDPFVPYTKPTTINLKGRNIQVIVKLANIHLTPDKPEYPGGSWHIEGMMNEAIMSTGIYYYDEENITENCLSFRMAVFGDLNAVLQHDTQAAELMFGIGKDEPTCQVVGSVVTKQGRCIAFPNLYQHQVQPFELADKSRPGHRKILALFLVDPALKHPRPSTSDIPPQQRDWMRTVLRDIAAGTPDGAANALGKLPFEILDMIVDQAEWLMGREEAEEHRLNLMDERSVMNGMNDEMMFQTAFNMCEH